MTLGKGGPGLLPPAGNGGLVALTSPPCGLLPAPSYGLQQPADMAGMIPNAKLQVDDRRNSSTGPALAPEAIGFGAVLQILGQTGELFR
jgi:hypothetical protein